MEEIRFTLRLTAELVAALREIAKEEQRSLHAQVVYILRRFVEERGRA